MGNSGSSEIGSDVFEVSVPSSLFGGFPIECLNWKQGRKDDVARCNSGEAEHCCCSGDVARYREVRSLVRVDKR